MNFPTPLSPWFVVQRFRDDGTISGDWLPVEYYRSMDDGTGTFSAEKEHAMLFMSLTSAARVAHTEGEGAHVRVLTTKEEVKEFGRE